MLTFLQLGREKFKLLRFDKYFYTILCNLLHFGDNEWKESFTTLQNNFVS